MYTPGPFVFKEPLPENSKWSPERRTGPPPNNPPALFVDATTLALRSMPLSSG